MKEYRDKSKSLHHAKLKSWGQKGDGPSRLEKIQSACGGGRTRRSHGGRIHKDIGGPLDSDGDFNPLDGGTSKPRGDRKARGNTQITLNINAGQPGQPPGPPPLGPPPPPPMAGPPPGMPMPPPGAMPPPGMPPRPPGMATGGRIHKDVGGASGCPPTPAPQPGTPAPWHPVPGGHGFRPAPAAAQPAPPPVAGPMPPAGAMTSPPPGAGLIAPHMVTPPSVPRMSPAQGPSVFGQFGQQQWPGWGLLQTGMVQPPPAGTPSSGSVGFNSPSGGSASMPFHQPLVMARGGRTNAHERSHHDFRRDDKHDRGASHFDDRAHKEHHDYRHDRHEDDNRNVRHLDGGRAHKDFGGGLGAAKMVRALPPQVAAKIAPKPTLPRGLGAPRLGFGLRAHGGAAIAHRLKKDAAAMERHERSEGDEYSRGGRTRPKDHDDGHVDLDAGGGSGAGRLEKMHHRNRGDK